MRLSPRRIAISDHSRAMDAEISLYDFSSKQSLGREDVAGHVETKRLPLGSVVPPPLRPRGHAASATASSGGYTAATTAVIAFAAGLGSCETDSLAVVNLVVCERGTCCSGNADIAFFACAWEPREGLRRGQSARCKRLAHSLEMMGQEREQRRGICIGPSTLPGSGDSFLHLGNEVRPRPSIHYAVSSHAERGSTPFR
jgi:hypothetical protein